MRESGRYKGVEFRFGGDVGVCKRDTFVCIGLSKLIVSMESNDLSREGIYTPIKMRLPLIQPS